METLPTKTPKRKPGFAQKLSTLALCGALVFGNISCQKTQKDVIKQQEKVESLSFQISHYIKARKDLVNKFNHLLQYPKTESNKSDINKSLSQMYEVITNYDEKIEKLAKDKIKAENDLNSYISEAKTSFPPTKPLDPNRWDYLLTTP